MLSDLHDAIAKVCPIVSLSKAVTGEVSILFDPIATDDQKVLAQHIVDTWVEPPPKRLVWALEFLDRFPEETQVAVVAAAQTNPHIRLWYDRLLANGSVDLDNDRLRAGLYAMQAAGLLTQEMIDNALK